MERMLAALDRMTIDTIVMDEELVRALDLDGAILVGFLLPEVTDGVQRLAALARRALLWRDRTTPGRDRVKLPADSQDRCRLYFARWLYEHGRLKD